MAAHQAPLSLGFSRQEYQSGLPFPSPMHACMLSRFSHVRLCATLWTAAHEAPLSTGFSKQEYWKYHFLLRTPMMERRITFWDRGIWPSIKHLVLQCDPKSLVTSAIRKSLQWEEFCEKEWGFLLCSRWYRAGKKKDIQKARQPCEQEFQQEQEISERQPQEHQPFGNLKKKNVQLQTSSRTWNEGLKHGVFVSNQIKLTTKTRDIWPIPPEWKWLNIRRKERKKRECREGNRSPITKFCLTSV